MAKVYLSSTLLDLKPEREAVIRWLIAANHQPVHSYVADSESVHVSCLNDIDDCDLYVLLLGHRYGFVPEKNNPEQLSITHLEFRHAGQRGLPRIVLLRTSVPDIKSSDLLDTVRYAKLQAFHQEASDPNATRPADFTDEAGLIHALSTGIQRELGKRIQAELEKRDTKAAQAEQRVAQLEDELRKAREAAVGRVLEQASEPAADELALNARQALLQGDTALAEQLLRQQEERAAVAAIENNHEAAERAREIAALALGRNSLTALSALMRAATYQPDDFRTRIELGDIQVILGQTEAALASYRTAFEMAKILAARDPANTQWQRDRSVSHIKIGNVLVAQGDGVGALVAYRKSLTIRETLATRDRANTEWQRDLSVSHNKIGDVLFAQGDGAGALAAYRKSLAIAETLVARDSANTQWQRDLSVSHNSIGDVLVAQGDGAGALVAFRKDLAIAEALAARDPANTEWQRDLSVSHEKIGDVLVTQGDGAGALAAYRKRLSIAETLAARDPANTQWQTDVAVSCSKLGKSTQLPLAERWAMLARGLKILRDLRQAGRLPLNRDWWPDAFEAELKKLDDAAKD